MSSSKKNPLFALPGCKRGSNAAQQTSQEFPFDFAFSRLSLRSGARFIRVLGRSLFLRIESATRLPAFLPYFRIPRFLHYRAGNTRILFRATDIRVADGEVSHLNRTPLFSRVFTCNKIDAPKRHAETGSGSIITIGSELLTSRARSTFHTRV